MAVMQSFHVYNLNHKNHHFHIMECSVLPSKTNSLAISYHIIKPHIPKKNEKLNQQWKSTFQSEKKNRNVLKYFCLTKYYQKDTEADSERTAK